MIEALFVVGTFWFWVMVLVALSLVSWAVNKENGFAAFFIFIFFGSLWYFFGSVSLEFVSWIWNKPLNLIGLTILYLAIGILWSLFKWRNYVLWMKNAYGQKGVNRPTFESHKGTIGVWITYWPFSIVGYMFSDFIENIVNFISSKLEGVYNSITARIYGKE